LTAHAERNNDGLLIPGRANGKRPDQLAKVTVPVEQLEGACPPADGRIRLRYGLAADFSDAIATDWVDVSVRDDSIHTFALKGLQPNTTYSLCSETTGPGGHPQQAPLAGTFETAPHADDVCDIRFCVMTCQGYPDRGHPDGHGIYPSMLALKPRFACLTGDLVYLDNDEPRAVSLALARYHWERMFSLPRLREFTRHVATYWLKDDHDTLNNDSWPGQSMGSLTFAEGQSLFRQQAPMAQEGPSYRTFRWGRDLQIWLTEGRDHRSANNAADSDRKTIWGDEQKAWLTSTLAASDATWKLLVSPTPLVGPDRRNKSDNHANAAFQNEGDEIRAWLAATCPDNAFVICGDRHWQYHSVHPETGLHEFCAGAASDQHAGGSPGKDPQYHRFHRVKGGFLSVDVSRRGDVPQIRFEHRDVEGKVVYHWEASGERSP
jgi:alkaline phosphatase D